jgi:hypothetical protein
MMLPRIKSTPNSTRNRSRIAGPGSIPSNVVDGRTQSSEVLYGQAMDRKIATVSVLDHSMVRITLCTGVTITVAAAVAVVTFSECAPVRAFRLTPKNS